jgi:hypothetical protein
MVREEEYVGTNGVLETKARNIQKVIKSPHAETKRRVI